MCHVVSGGEAQDFRGWEQIAGRAISALRGGSRWARPAVQSGLRTAFVASCLVLSGLLYSKDAAAESPSIAAAARTEQDAAPAPQTTRKLSPFYWYSKDYGGRLWSYPGDVYSHLKDDLSHHGFSDVELRGLSPIQLQRLHSAHHEGLISPGREPAPPSRPIDSREAAMAYRAHANAWFLDGNFTEALADYHVALRLDPTNSDVNSSLAWFHASCRDAQFRDGPKAVRYAQQACGVTNYAIWNQVGTLAAAYAEAGQFDQAVKWARRSYELAPKDEKPGCEQRLRLYESGKSLRRK